MPRKLLLLAAALILSCSALLTAPDASAAWPPYCDCYYCAAVPDSPCDFGGTWGVYTCQDFLNYYPCF